MISLTDLKISKKVCMLVCERERLYDRAIGTKCKTVYSCYEFQLYLDIYSQCIANSYVFCRSKIKGQFSWSLIQVSTPLDILQYTIFHLCGFQNHNYKLIFIQLFAYYLSLHWMVRSRKGESITFNKNLSLIPNTLSIHDKPLTNWVK